MPEESEPPGGLNIGGMISVGRGARARADRRVEGFEVVAEQGVDAVSLWAMQRRFAAGVTVVTTMSGEGYLGITVSAFCLVSLEPPLVLVCINEESQAIEAIVKGRVFAVTVLSSRQEFLSELFAGRGPRPDPAFSTIAHRTLLTGAPILEGGLAWLDCRLQQAIPSGDHTICIGSVVAAGVAEGQDEPLLYFGSQYRRFAP